MLMGAGGLVALLVSGWSVALAVWARSIGGGAVAAAVFAGVLAAGWDVLSFPLALYSSLLLDRKYGLSSESVGTWSADHLKALARVSRLLRDRQVCEKLRGAEHPDAIYALLTEPQASHHAA